MLRYIPDPYPDELIYSVWARFSNHMHYPGPDAVFQDLFGDRAVSATVDLPCHLQKFCNNLPPGAELNVETILDYHTLLPYYRPFLPPERYLAIRHQMIAGSGHGLHLRTGISGSLVARPAYLRYCPLCLKEDKATLGDAYWHRLHQVPGVEMCLEHEVFLEHSPFHVNTRLGQRFVSAQQIKDPVSARDARSSPLYVYLKDIAINSAYILNHTLPPRDAKYIREQFHTLLAQESYLTWKGNVRIREFAADFQNYYPDSLLTLLHCEIDWPQDRHNIWLIRLVWAKESIHPLYHILAVLFLKSSVPIFFQEPLITPRSTPFGQGPWPCLNPICPLYKHLHIHACRIRQLAKSTYRGVFACDCGFEYTRIISEATPDELYRYNSVLAYGKLWESTLSDLWQDTHLSAGQIAQVLGICVGTLRQKVKLLDLPSRIQVQEPKKKIPSGAEIADHRTRWLKTKADYAEQGVFVTMKQSKGNYHWLRTYDLTWLKAHLPPRKVRQLQSQRWQGRDGPYISRRRGRPLPQDWERLDRVADEAIRRRAQELLDAPGAPQKITLLKLHQGLFHPTYHYLNAVSLPITKQAIDEVLESTEHFAVRRVNWVTQQCLAERKFLSRHELVRKAGVGAQQHKPLVQAAIQEGMRKLASLE